MNRPLPLAALLAGSLLLGACSHGSGAGTSDTTQPLDLERVDGWPDTGASLQLAAALLRADRGGPGGPGASLPFLDAALASEWVETADGALRSLLLESGSGVDSVWSPLIGALAEDKDAPPDGNDNGTNRDEVLARLRERYVFRSNARLPAGIAPSFFLPGQVPDRLAQAPTSRDDAARLRLPPVPAANLTFTPGDLGALVLAATRRAASLLAIGRGDLYGRTGEEGVRGLLLLEQVLGAERLLLAELTFDGKALGGIADPARYDPAKEPRVFPARIAYILEDGGKGLPRKVQAFFVKDRGANLLDQARLLRGFAELAWLASAQQPNPLLRRLFEGDPFGRKPTLVPQLATAPDTAGRPLAGVTWDGNVRGLLQSSCAGGACHFPGRASGFSVGTYDTVLAGGDHAATNPTVVKGDSRQSLLWQVTALATPPVAQRMPRGGPYLSVAETDLLAEWIDAGAPKSDAGGAVEPRYGRDGIDVVLRNLTAMHLHAASGALVDRADLQGQGALVKADSAGEILQALAAVREAVPGLAGLDELITRHAQFVASHLVEADGRVRESHLLEPDEAASAPAAVGEAAALVAGLFEADRVLTLPDVRAVAARAARYLSDRCLLRIASFPDGGGARFTPTDVARACEALAAWYAATNDAAAPAVLVELVGRLKRAGLVLAEWPATGEAFGDSDPDSDKDGVPEVGVDLLPPLFASALENRLFRTGAGVPVRRVHYSRDILPILVVHCGDCHTGAARLGDFQLDTWTDLFRGGDYRDRWRTVVPFDVTASLLYRKVQDRPPPLGDQMPQARPPLAPAARALIRAWIEQGAVRD